jgi:hypothetical protein
MQRMPRERCRPHRARYGLAADPFDPHDNILAGAAYIRWASALRTPSGDGSSLPDETQAHVATLAPLMGSNRLADRLSRS